MAASGEAVRWPMSLQGIAMIKLVLCAALAGLLAGCSGMSGTSEATAAWTAGTVSPPRSPGEGPSFFPVYP
jgi:hypothetical protein